MGTTPVYEARRSERRPHRFEVTLLGKSKGMEFQEPAHTLDVSDHGLGIRTDNAVNPARTMHPGQVVYVYGVGDVRFGYCRIVWVQSNDLNSPSRAGLEFLN